ncbi:RNA polymerase I specific transcription initiation factor [Cordyceps fumosorosea ARSEF 2679]|uniref:RNA polymerase I specific transcription initiation factor n=1 Tax=Cordyceps fumosorosea (strain ARSEF 2679) TaxID=1081104 RepID=A0A162LCX9_CORFA|nr:RNA polymerase I specific transcription initiation factor [Cordyceps fumosorosea ARSEF 2679]OAA68824.1 RNA polymerase I specific transcription initiation factor [Cordyceps fumosorosea ARSEF 2679]
MSQHEADWDLDTDEITSVGSEELYESRPNRWKGPKSTWRHLTEEERLLWRSTKQLQDEDLSVHLYNAFVLKQRAANPEIAKDQTIQTDDGQEAIWAPPQSWTAWPMRQKHIPRAGLFKEEGDEDDAFTFRRKEKATPSSELRAETTATILRIAKERFSRRKPPQTMRPSIETLDSPSPDDDIKGPSSDESEAGISSQPDENQATDASGIDDDQSSRRRKRADQTFDPVVSADDDLSMSLLKESVGHILSQVDKTLTILHHTRVAGLSYQSDSSETETEQESDTTQTSTRKRGRGRPRLPPQPRSAESSTSRSTTRRGRPKTVHIPEPGETLEQMALRVARRGHRRLPTTEADREAAFEEWLRQGDERVAREQRRLSSHPVSEESESQDDDDNVSTRTNRGSKIRCWGLRDWSDLVGAAALAGFPPGVVERTAQRCANLFGQGMSLTRLDEAPAARAAAAAAVHTTTYQPERIRLSATPNGSEDDDGDNDWESAAGLQQRRIVSRQASLARSSREASAAAAASSPRSSHSPSQPMSRSSSTGGFLCPVASCDRAVNGFSRKANLERHMQVIHSGDSDGGPSPSRSRSRSRSVSRSSAGILFCPVARCERAANGFTRRANLQRHMQLLHPGIDASAALAAAAAVSAAVSTVETPEDSDDEILGAVHVDGFLRTVNPGKGWRGEDAAPRQRRKRPATPPAGRATKKLSLSSSEYSE